VSDASSTASGASSTSWRDDVNPREAERYLLDLELFGMRFGLDRMYRLMTALGMPQRRFASIHVVGSNGKSSTTRMIAAILERHGLRTGSYTSPHLRSFAERIEVREREVTEQDFAAAVSRAAHAAELVDRTAEPGDEVTQFEALTAAAYHELARQRVHVAVVEAGLGGRYDATNVIPSRVQVLTSVALEHTRWLGPTIRDIAEEKLAVVRDHGRLVTGSLPAEAEAVAERVASERHARRLAAPGEAPAELRARGAVQRRNFALAMAATEAFLDRPLDPNQVRRAAAEVEIPGRLELVDTRPLVIHDGAHNPAGAAVLAEALPELVADRSVVGVVAVLDDKDAAGILGELLPLLSHVVVTRAGHPRSLPPGTLVSLAERLTEAPVEPVPDPRQAVARARSIAGPDGAVLVTGSLRLIADLERRPGAQRASTL
jgi:dihydrofolate synthase/folylpolyglutamate synthase